jgi:hypothetical protein
MKTILKLFAFFIGLSSLLLNFNSCKKDDSSKKDDSEDTVECCSWTYDGTKYKYCEGDSYDGVELTGAAWTNFKAYVKDYYGATCRQTQV